MPAVKWSSRWVREAGLVFAVLLASVAVNQTGRWYGRAFIPPGLGYPRPPAIARDLFRFDATYYLDIATAGYAYDGDPMSSPNIVFAPAFPLLVRAIPFAAPVDAGFALNFLLLAGAIFCGGRVLAREFGARVAAFATLAQVTAAGGYAFHAFYSESTMLFFWTAALLARQRRSPWWLALAAGGLGAARIAAFPLVLLFAIDLWRHGGRGVGARVAMILIATAGVGGYLGYLAVAFGNPFRLLPEIQAASWGLFHPPTVWWKVATGTYLMEHLRAAFTHPVDIRTINLAWTGLALASVAALWSMRAPRWYVAQFAAYVLFVYALSSSSEFIISAHRFYALVTPIFVVPALATRRWPRAPALSFGAIFLSLNAALGIWHAGCFNQGTWFFF